MAIYLLSVEQVLELPLFYPAFECGPVTLLHGNFQLPKLRQSKLAAAKKGHFGSSHWIGEMSRRIQSEVFILWIGFKQCFCCAKVTEAVPRVGYHQQSLHAGECQKLSAEAVAAKEQHDTGRETWNVVPVAFHLSLWTPIFFWIFLKRSCGLKPWYVFQADQQLHRSAIQFQ